MKMQFGLAHLTALSCTPPELIYIASEAGYDFISPRLILMGNEPNLDCDLTRNPAMLRKTKAALSETGIRVHDIELARIFQGVDFGSYLPAFEIAAELSARHVLSSIWTPDLRYATDRFQELCDLVAPFGLTVNLEFVSWADVKDLKSAMDVVTNAQRENVGIMVDVLHFHRSKVQLPELDLVPRRWFNFMHLCDAPPEIPSSKEDLIKTGREERLYLGEGGIDVASIVSRLPEVPYIIELPNARRIKEFGALEHVRRCLQTARSYLESNLLQASG
jgi:sugar phosphate isomerase/epimerase